MRPVPSSVVLRFLGVLGLVAPLVVGACSSSDPGTTEAAASKAEPPPRVCKAPAAAPNGTWFTDVTADVGLAAHDGFEPLGNTVIAADLDGDGWVDLLAQHGFSSRGTPKDGTLAGKRTRFVLLNRPDPANPAHRVYVDATNESGILATRDGTNDHGYGLVNVGDLDGDGDVDVITCSPEPPPDKDPCWAYLNDGKAHFTLAAPSDLDKKMFWVPGATLLDFDRDGILDFWPATVAHWPYDPSLPDQPPTLFAGIGDGTFVNVSASVGLPTRDGIPDDGTEWRHVFGTVACDLDGDGDDDMVFASYGREENQVWRNDGGGHFTNVAAEWGIDHDDRVDFSDDQSYRCYCQANPTKCAASVPPPDMSNFCTVFNGKYGRGWAPGITDQPYALGGNYFSFACGDIDDDGDMDLVSATIVHGDVGSAADPSEIILNSLSQGGKFTRPGNDKTGLLRQEKGILWNHGDDMAVLVDVDLDGRKDILMTTTGAYEPADRTHLWHQKSDGTFEEMGITSGIAPASLKPNLQGPAFVDIDGDGDLDLVIGDTANGNLRVLRNDIGQAQNLLRVRLAGKGFGASNASAIGAVVHVTAGGRTQTQYVSGGHGHGNVQADLVLTFGLGSACDVDAIDVRWPDAAGTVTHYTHVVANYTVEIREGEAEVRYPYADREKR